jgi:hypothetical protein
MKSKKPNPRPASLTRRTAAMVAVLAELESEEMVDHESALWAQGVDEFNRFVADEKMAGVWDRLNKAKLRDGCKRWEALSKYAWTAMLNAENLWLPGKKSDVKRSLEAIRSSARKLKTELRKLGRLSAPIRFEPFPNRNVGTVTVQNIPRETRYYMAMSEPGTWPEYIDLESVLDRVMKAEAGNAVLAGFDEIYPTQISRGNARAKTLVNVLLQSTKAYFQEAPKQAISETVAAHYSAADPIDTARYLRRRGPDK